MERALCVNMHLQNREKMSGEVREFHWVKALSIVLLFFVHSTLSMTQWPAMQYIQYFMLSNFFFVSGYLLFASQKKGLKRLAKSKLVGLYLPFLLFLVLYQFVFPFPWFNERSNVAYLYHATLLSIFQKNITGIYDLHHLWFVPVLLAFMAFFVILEKTVNRLSLQVSIVALLFVTNGLLWRFNSAAMLSDTFSLFLLNFSAGFWIAKKAKLDAIRDRRVLPIIVVSYVMLFFTPGYISQEQYWLRQSVLALLATLIAVNLLQGIRVSSVVKAISISTLMAYLLEPQIRYEYEGIFGVDFFRTPLQNMVIPMVLRIATTLVIGFVAQKLLDILANSTRLGLSNRTIRYLGSIGDNNSGTSNSLHHAQKKGTSRRSQKPTDLTRALRVTYTMVKRKRQTNQKDCLCIT
jgi:hypothetical protein